MANGKKKSKRVIYILSAFIFVVVVVVGLVAATRGTTKIDPSKLAKVERGDLAKSVRKKIEEQTFVPSASSLNQARDDLRAHEGSGDALSRTVAVQLLDDQAARYGAFDDVALPAAVARRHFGRTKPSEKTQ